MGEAQEARAGKRGVPEKIELRELCEGDQITALGTYPWVADPCLSW
jgi:hypothetical protein